MTWPGSNGGLRDTYLCRLAVKNRIPPLRMLKDLRARVLAPASLQWSSSRRV